MKYIKKYEYLDYYFVDKIYNCKIGDYMVCINSVENELTYGKKYEILRIKDWYHKKNYTVEVLNDRNIEEFYYSYRFVIENEFKEIKFNV